MCEWNQTYSSYAHFMMQFPNVRQGVCHGCNSAHLSHSEMYPPGHCSRSLCQACYNRMFNRINHHCVVCGTPIPHKVPMQQQNWREIENHLCDDPQCKAAWATRHAIVTGAAQQQAVPLYQRPIQPISDPDVIDAEYYEHQPVRVLPPPQPLGLPVPDRSMSFAEVQRQFRQCIPELIEIDLTKRR